MPRRSTTITNLPLPTPPCPSWITRTHAHTPFGLDGSKTYPGVRVQRPSLYHGYLVASLRVWTWRAWAGRDASTPPPPHAPLSGWLLTRLINAITCPPPCPPPPPASPPHPTRSSRPTGLPTPLLTGALLHRRTVLPILVALVSNMAAWADMLRAFPAVRCCQCSTGPFRTLQHLSLRWTLQTLPLFLFGLPLLTPATCCGHPLPHPSWCRCGRMATRYICYTPWRSRTLLW